MIRNDAPPPRAAAARSTSCHRAEVVSAGRYNDAMIEAGPDTRRGSRVAVVVIGVLTRGLGIGSLTAFSVFLLFGPFTAFPFVHGDAARLAVDAGLSLAFFAQHSAMARNAVRRRIGRWTGDAGVLAAYAIASSIALVGVLLLWQRSDAVVIALSSPWRWVWRGWALVAWVGGLWSRRVLGAIDTFGDRALRQAAQSAPTTREAPRVSAVLCREGPYRHVRHPMYVCTILLLWSGPDLTADRLLLGVLWTTWILVSARWEEANLLREFGEAYEAYRRAVPMWLPRRRPAALGSLK